MRRKKSSVLIIVIIMTSVITIFGLGLMSLQTFSGVEVVKATQSGQAFWLTEAGIARAFFNFTPSSPYSAASIPLGNGTYTVTTELKPGFSYRWIIESIGTVSSKNRKIQVELGPNVMKAIQTTGTLSAPGGGGLADHIEPDDSYTEGYAPLFTEVFHMSEADMKNIATHVYTDAPNDPTPVDGITWIDMDNGDLKIASNNWTGSGILVVDFQRDDGTYNSNGTFTIEGGHFEGIIWINGGNKMINGNNVVNGAIFIYDPDDGETKLTGVGDNIAYDQGAIDAAFGAYGGFSPDTFRYLSNWQEIPY